MEAWEAARNALECVLETKKGEDLVIFCDHEKSDIGNAFAAGALKIGLQTRLVRLTSTEGAFRTRIPPEIAEILENPPTVYINILRGVREETPFRIELIRKETADRKARLGHCPGMTLDMLTSGALALSVEEHRKMQAFANNMIRKLNQVLKLNIANPAGTNLRLSVEGRPFFTDTIINWETLKWMNLPTGEVIVAPVEDSMEGTLVCDMAIGGIGPIKAPVKLSVKRGRVQNVSCEDEEVLKRVKGSLDTDEGSNRLGEFAFGINPKARYVEEFLEAEKILGTIHVAFGNNADMPGGKNPSRNHMDLLLSKPTVEASYDDGSGSQVLVSGLFK